MHFFARYNLCTKFNMEYIWNESSNDVTRTSTSKKWQKSKTKLNKTKQNDIYMAQDEDFNPISYFCYIFLWSFSLLLEFYLISHITGLWTPIVFHLCLLEKIYDGTNWNKFFFFSLFHCTQIKYEFVRCCCLVSSLVT